MILSMRSLFLKIFLWFWITVIATGIALVVTWIILQPKNAQSQIQTILADTALASGTATVDELEQAGTSAASAYMQEFSQKSHLKTCLFDIVRDRPYPAVTAPSLTGSCGPRSESRASRLQLTGTASPEWL